MSSFSYFAPVYRPPAKQQSFLTREQKSERKRKRRDTTGDTTDDDDDDADSDTQAGNSPQPDRKLEDRASSAPRVLHPVNRTDPYHVAGLARDADLPGDNFPHAATKEPTRKPDIEKELAQLNPPLFVPTATLDDQAGSFKRRHLDNLTAILHKCILAGDWERASRVWGLILRTEIQGRGIDVRHNGRWLVGAEILMRRDQTIEPQRKPPASSSTVDEGQSHDSEDDVRLVPVISDEGFRLAKDYYERLSLQYPHRPRAHTAAVNSLVIHPVMFNVWIYEVQERAKRAKLAMAELSIAPDIDDSNVSADSEKSDSIEKRHRLREITNLELKQASTIAERMDNLMLNPPYDTSPELLQLRSMVCLWLFDLHMHISGIRSNSRRGSFDEDDEDIGTETKSQRRESRRQHESRAKRERETASRIMQKMASESIEVPNQLRSFVEDVEETEMEDEDDTELG